MGRGFGCAPSLGRVRCSVHNAGETGWGAAGDKGLRGVGLIAVLGATLLSAGCGLLPVSGPNALAIKSGATWHGPPYGLVKLTPQVVKTLDEYGPRTLTAVFGDRRPPPEIKFGIGDVVSVTIFEAAAGGLFIPAEAGVRPGNFVTLPNQPVDTKGFISVPYAGLVPTAGKTPAEVDKEIVEPDQKSGDRAAGRGGPGDPEHLAHHRHRRGEYALHKPDGPHPGAAGGRAPARRDHPGRRPQGSGPGHVGGAWSAMATAPRCRSVRWFTSPATTSGLGRGDTIYLYKEPQTFLAFGASGQQGQFQFSAGRSRLPGA